MFYLRAHSVKTIRGDQTFVAFVSAGLLIERKPRMVVVCRRVGQVVRFPGIVLSLVGLVSWCWGNMRVRPAARTSDC